jgi:hypothetical protein
MTVQNKPTPVKPTEGNFFDGMQNYFKESPEDEIKDKKIRVGDKVTQDDKECIVIATPEDPQGYIIPDKYYCIIKDIASSKKYFFKL